MKTDPVQNAAQGKNDVSSIIHVKRPSKSVGRNGHLSILVVDDRVKQALDFRERILCSPILQELHPEVDVASSFDEAVSKLSKKYYDVGIPNLHCTRYEDGISIIKEMKAHKARAIALVSASDIDDEMLSKIQKDVSTSNGNGFALKAF